MGRGTGLRSIPDPKCSILCVWIIFKLGLVDRYGIFQQLHPFSSIRYFFWLTVEIGKADWAIAKFILSPEMPNQQRLIRVPAPQSTDVGKVLFANSITITPGTVTVETESDELIVHALTDDAADLKALQHMGEKVSKLENRALAGELS